MHEQSTARAAAEALFATPPAVVAVAGSAVDRANDLALVLSRYGVGEMIVTEQWHDALCDEMGLPRGALRLWRGLALCVVPD